MVAICPGCHKKLNVSASASGRKVRCPGCKTVVAVPGRQGAAVPSAVQEAPGRVGAPGSPDPSGGVGAAPATAVMRCAKCKAASVERLPPNQFSRNPGYVCSACGAKMRPPGSIIGYVFATILGAFVALFGLFAAAAGITAEAAANFRGRVLVGAVTMVGLGAVVAGWAGRQLLLPVPLDAPARPSRLLFAIVVLLSVIVVGLLIIGGCLFGFMYYLHEMM